MNTFSADPPDAPATDGVAGTVVATPTAGGADVAAPVQAGAWLKIDKSLGPISLKRIGAAYQSNRLWILFDAEVGAAGLTCSVSGLGLGVNVGALSKEGKFDVQAALSGLSLDYKNAGVEIGGAFLNKTDPNVYDLYVAGGAVISTPTVGFQALGAYQKKKVTKDPSLFLVAALTGKLPGPPPFRLKGIVAGFGYNSHLRVPEISEVTGFPLLAMLPDAEDAQVDHEPMKVLGKLLDGPDPWVNSQAGTIWLAAGISFSSFELVHCRAVALVEFGQDIAVSICGTASAQFPREGKAYANVELAVAASYSTATNVLSFDGQLTSNSFLLDPNAHLRGGFAVRRKQRSKTLRCLGSSPRGRILGARWLLDCRPASRIRAAVMPRYARMREGGHPPQGHCAVSANRRTSFGSSRRNESIDACTR